MTDRFTRQDLHAGLEVVEAIRRQHEDGTIVSTLLEVGLTAKKRLKRDDVATGLEVVEALREHHRNDPMVSVILDLGLRFIRKRFTVDNHHTQVYFIREGDLIWVDEGIADLMVVLWDRGIRTKMSCQRDPGRSSMWIKFKGLDDMDAFLKLVGKSLDDVTNGIKDAMIKPKPVAWIKNRWCYTDDDGYDFRFNTTATGWQIRPDLFFPREAVRSLIGPTP